MMAQHWTVICNESDAPALWRTWLNEKCVAIGWPPIRHHLEGLTENTSWDIARARLQEVQVGDIVFPYLMRYRFGIPGEVVKIAIADSEWKPTAPKGTYRRNFHEAELGRRIELKWLEKGAPPRDKVALVPAGMRTSGGEVKQTIERLRPERFARFTEIIRNPSNPDFKLEEVTFDLGRLDILCIDPKNRTTIIELQLGYLDDGHIGKICRYYGWFTLRYGPSVRAILLFENASEELLDAYRKALPWLEMKKVSWQADIKMESC
jgi:hypothetical protein